MIAFLGTSLWSPEFSESLNRRSMNQLANACKTNKKTAVVCPSPFQCLS